MERKEFTAYKESICRCDNTFANIAIQGHKLGIKHEQDYCDIKSSDEDGHLNSALGNSEFYVHSLRPHLLTVRESKETIDGNYSYLSYGACFWCRSRHSFETIAKAKRRYAIDIQLHIFYRQ